MKSKYSLLPNSETLQLAKDVRKFGGFCRFNDSTFPGSLLSVSGRDAGPFLQGQLTNEVSALALGEGNLSARVSRTGHLRSLFSLHKISNEEITLHFTEKNGAKFLLEELDQFLFSEDVRLNAIETVNEWMFLTGERAADALQKSKFEAPALYGTCGKLNGETFLFSRPIWGEDGCWVSASTENLNRLENELLQANFKNLSATEFDSLSEIFRIEMGHLKFDVDAKRGEVLLPETGLEHQAVSYNKGCFLGQEVIARVRTYGSTPNALRALVVSGIKFQELEQQLPPAGSKLIEMTEDGAGKEIGKILSRTVSPELDSLVALALLNREKRTPGTNLVLQAQAGPVLAEVRLLPIFEASSSDARVESLYDQAVRAYSEGQDDEAISSIEKALRLKPSFEEGYETLGVMLGQSERYHEAIDLFRRLEEVAPYEPMVNTNLSLYLMKIGDQERAEEEASKATIKKFSQAANPESAKELEAQERKRIREDALKKREMFEEVLTIDDRDPVALYGLGGALYILGEFDQSAKVLENAVEVGKDNSAVYLAFGKTLEKLEHFEKASTVYEKGIHVASKKGDLMPLKEMERRKMLISQRESSL